MSQRWCLSGFVMLSLGGVLTTGGCSGGVKLPARAPVTGTVALNGKTLAEVNVLFIPLDEAKGRSASGKTDAAGKYVLQSFETNDGAVPGQYKVVITRPISDAVAFKEKKLDGAGSAGSEGDKIPAKYSSPKSTDLKATVEAKPNDIPFDLK